MSWDKFVFGKFGEFDARVREQEGRRPSQKEFVDWLAAASGVTIPESTMSAWLKGARYPHDMEVIQALAKILGPDVYDALGLPRPMPDDPLFKDLLRVAEKLPPDKRRKLLDAARRLAEGDEANTGPKLSSYARP